MSDEERRKAVEKNLQAMRKGLADRAAENAEVQREAAKLDEELRNLQEGNGK